MPSQRDAAELPVLVIYNLDTGWEQEDKNGQTAEIERMSSSLEELGHPVSLLEINGNTLHRNLAGYKPNDWIVMNLCEEIPGVPHSEAAVVHTLEKRNMVYTGSPPEIIGNCEDKQYVKQTLAARGLPLLLGVYDTPSALGWNCFPQSSNRRTSTAASASAPNPSYSTARSWNGKSGISSEPSTSPLLSRTSSTDASFMFRSSGTAPCSCSLPSRWISPPARIFTTGCAPMTPSSSPARNITKLSPRTSRRPSVRENTATSSRPVSSAFGPSIAAITRLDIRLRDGIFYILDINPNPDISSDASMACAAEHIGLSYGELGSHLVRLAASRHPVLG